MIRVVWQGATAFAAASDRLVIAANAASKEATQFTAAMLVRQAKINSTGPPRLARGERPGEGPGVVTGRHRNSIVVVSQGPTSRFGWQVTVAPTARYSRRLELGFTGTDSRGRHYNQPPYPYFKPAYDFVIRYVAGPAYQRAWAAALKL